MKTPIFVVTAFVTLLSSCQPASRSSLTQNTNAPTGPTPVKLDVIKETQTVVLPEGDEVVVSIGEIRQMPAVNFELNSEKVAIIQLKTAKDAADANAECAALENTWRILRESDLVALLASGNIGGVYNSMSAIPGVEASLAFPAWVEASADNKVALLTYVEGSSMLTTEQLSAQFGQEAAHSFQTTAAQNTTVYCISGEIK